MDYEKDEDLRDFDQEREVLNHLKITLMNFDHC